jgi:niacin transporter
MKNGHIMKLAISGLLIAVGLIIPMFSPLKIVLEPASYTLASHVAIFIAMFISPFVAVTVAVGTAAGFFLGGFPPIIVLRAATHVLFAAMGAFYLHKVVKHKLSALKLRLFSFCVALIHAVGELLVVSDFYFGYSIGEAYREQGFVVSVLLMVGVGTVVHSMLDFEIARIVVLPLRKQKNLASLFSKGI